MTEDTDDETAGIGHNSGTPLSNESKVRLKSIVERIERLNEEIKGLTDDRKDIFEEAKGAGFDVKSLRTILAMRKKEAEEVATQTAVTETYARALGMSSYLE